MAFNIQVLVLFVSYLSPGFRYGGLGGPTLMVIPAIL
jgi:hypothetical protein